MDNTLQKNHSINASTRSSTSKASSDTTAASYDAEEASAAPHKMSMSEELEHEFILRAQDQAWYEGADSPMPFYKKELPTPLSFPEPQSVATLQERLEHILGRSIAELSALALLEPPRQSSGAKGYVGQLIELFLGAHSHNRPDPDFIDLGIELKTMPVGFDLMPQESTFVCSATINPRFMVPFTQSALYHKLKHVLFVLILAPKSVKLTLGERRVLGYFFFQLQEPYFKTIETDYNEFQEMIFAGHAREIDGSMGTLVQLRPKATHANEVICITDSEGNRTYTKPRGYYLRTSFTRELVNTFIREQGLESHLKHLLNFKQRLNLDS